MFSQRSRKSILLVLLFLSVEVEVFCLAVIYHRNIISLRWRLSS